MSIATSGSLLVPDRFDQLEQRDAGELRNIVVPVDEGLEQIDHLYRDTLAAGRGGFLIVRGDSGSGKSTFLKTVGLFREGVEYVIIERSKSVEECVRALPVTTKQLRMVIIDGRDALKEVPTSEIESIVHEINSFIRSRAGVRTIVFWPVNTDDLEQALIRICEKVGADSLLGVGSPSYRFSGPPKQQFLEIANRTIGTLNQGASITALGVTEDRAKQLVDAAATVGRFMGLLRKELLNNQGIVESLIKKERCRLWIVVVAGNEPYGEVNGLTRGTQSAVDIDRLINATNANVVKELKKSPEKLGILGSVMDAKLLHLPTVTALEITREHAGQELIDAMKAAGMSTQSKGDAQERMKNSDLYRAFAGVSLGTQTPGPKVGSNTQDAFEKLMSIASTNDGLLNETIGMCLKKAAIIQGFETERDLGTGLTRYTDLVCKTSGDIIRIEVMWRSRTSRAEIANYTLQKLSNYGKAIELLK